MKYLILIVAISLSVDLLANSRQKTAERLNQLQCFTDLADDFAEWDSRDTWKAYGLNSAGYQIYRSPTLRIGSWIQLTVSKSRVHAALLLSADRNHKVQFDASCQRRESEFERPLDDDLMALGLTDAMLADDIARFKAGSGGIVLAWSPHMPWSLEMLDFVKKVAAEKNLKLTVTLDPHADPDYAREVAAKHGLAGDDIFRPIQSLELIFRGMTTHYPSVLRYGEAGFSRLLPGREIASALTAYVEQEAEAMKDQPAPILEQRVSFNWLLMSITLIGLVAIAAYLNYRKQGKIA